MQPLVRRLLNPVFWLGLLLIVSYWLYVRPPANLPGFSEDLCYADMTRQLMSQEIHDHGRPTFSTDRFMTPMGASIPYMSWGIERDWIGAKFWDWNRDFPFIWASYGASMLIAFLGVGFILLRMSDGTGMRPSTAWALATLVTLFHVPRHFKAWHHEEHLMQHWIYLSIFLDAWIWQKAWRERRWSLTLECWRVWLLVAMTGTVGYFWGALILEWAVVRLSLAILWAVGRIRRRRHPDAGAEAAGTGRGALGFELNWRSAAAAAGLSVAMLALYLRWFLPLGEEARKLGEVWSGLGWFVEPRFWFRPLWLDIFLPPGALAGLDTPETVVSIGWIYWVPAVVALFAMWRRRGSTGSGSGFGSIAPFFALIVIGITYASWNQPPYYFQAGIQKFVPFMSFFRVATRWSLFMPQFFTALVVLAWPDLRAWAKRRRSGRLAPAAWAALVVFVALSVIEFRWLLYPVNAQPPLPGKIEKMLTSIRDLPGTSVLNLPFCVAGGNGYCTERQCPNYPYSSIAQCLRLWHEKKIYGLYQARMTPAHCAIYDKQPYNSWFEAFAQQRCFSPPEWKEFCDYLDHHSEISAILLLPEVWRGAGNPQCLDQFVSRLGPPKDVGTLPISPTRGGQGANPVHLVWFGAKCGAH